MTRDWKRNTTIYGYETETRVETSIRLVDDAAEHLNMPYALGNIIEKTPSIPPDALRGVVWALIFEAAAILAVWGLVWLAWFALGSK